MDHDAEAVCPRCSRRLLAPNLWSSAWQCPEHGAVPPVHPVPEPTADWMRSVCAKSSVPVWLPWPLASGWVLSAVAPVGNAVSGVPAVATALTGPNPLGGPAEMLIVAEEPGVGFAAHAAGLPGPDPGRSFDDPPYAYVEIHHHPVPLWLVRSDRDQAVVVGERDLIWLWVVTRPASAGALLVDRLTFTDARQMGEEVRLLPYGARSTWLDPV